jgi:hypothetical protein
VSAPNELVICSSSTIVISIIDLELTKLHEHSELRFELGIKGSILDHLDYQHTFPHPPNLNNQQLQDQSSDQQSVGWYFYLSEIAARHLINRILKAQSAGSAADGSSAGKLESMLADLEMYETQLHEWYNLLPPRISFPLPSDTGKPCPDEFQQILRSRFMFIRDLCYRPFIQLCLNHTLDIPHELMVKAAGAASRGLQHCAWRLQFMSSHRTHSQGLWFMIRVMASCSMILIGAVRARDDVLLNAAALLQIPEDWRGQIMRVLDILSPFAREKRGGVRDCIQLVKSALQELV